MTKRRRPTFAPNAVWIPDGARWRDRSGEHVDANDCTLLMVEGDNLRGELFTREEWEKEDGRPSYIRSGRLNQDVVWALDAAGNESPVQEGNLELLPDIWIVKIAERLDWCPEVRDRTCRLFGVYAFNRRKHVYICSFEPTYELHFLETQYDETEEVMNDDDLHEELERLVREGDVGTDPVSYFGVYDIDAILRRHCRPGFLPESEAGGGYAVSDINDMVTAVTEDDALAEVREICNTASV